MESLLDVLVWAAQAAGAGAISFLAQQLLKNAQNRLSRLRSTPESELSQREQDMLELLTHFEDEVGSFEASEIDSLGAIKLLAEVRIAFWKMQLQAMTDGERSRAD